MLSIHNLHTTINDKEIIKGLSLKIKPGEVHALMGPNGSGKSTLASTVMGHPDFQIKEGKVEVDGEVINDMEPEDRAKAGLFLAFQHPITIPGVSLVNFLRTAYKHVHPADKQVSALDFFKQVKEIASRLNLSEELLKRSLNEGLSGGERKKLETLQLLVLKPKYIILDELDTGTDVDALKILGQTIQQLMTKEQKNKRTKKQKNNNLTKKQFNNEDWHSPGILLITHYNRIFQYIKPDFVHVLKEGKLVASGDASLVEEIERDGYGHFSTTTH